MRPKRVVVWAVVDRHGKMEVFAVRDDARVYAKIWNLLTTQDAPHTIVRCEGTLTKPKGRKK
jgi:uncharacterized protein GlcG (DUF336 family)